MNLDWARPSNSKDFEIIQSVKNGSMSLNNFKHYLKKKFNDKPSWFNCNIIAHHWAFGGYNTLSAQDYHRKYS